MRNCGLSIAVALLIPVGPLHAETVPGDFLLSLLRFGVECRQVAAPRKTYLGDATRFAVTVEQPATPSAEEKPSPSRVTYRAFYKDLAEPTASEARVTMRCKGVAKCVAVYRGGAVERADAFQISTCSPRTATLVLGATRELIRSATP
jgi:hypothetical protein